MSRIATRDRAAPRRIGTYDAYPPNTRVSVACTMPHRDIATRADVSAATDPSRGAHARARVAGDHATDPSVHG